MAQGEDLEKLRAHLLEAPELAIVADNAIGAEALEADSFDLSLRVGPIYDIVRHPGTQTPTTIAIYGDWGAGKTSAMRWLEGRLRAWNADKTVKDKVRVHPV